MIASGIWIIGAAVQCSAQNVAHLIVGRLVSGLAIGITSSQCCVYLAELAPARIRGRVVGIQQWSIEWGILIMYLISYGCVQGVSGPSAFRIAWGIQAVPGLILGVALIFFPESPRWLAGQERWDECLDVLSDCMPVATGKTKSSDSSSKKSKRRLVLLERPRISHSFRSSAQKCSSGPLPA